MATTTQPPAGSPDKIKVAKYDGENAVAKCWRGWDEYAARVDIERGGETWVRVITDSGAAKPVASPTTIPDDEWELPAWVQEALRGLDVHTISVERV